LEGVGAGEFIDQAGQTEAAHAVIGATRGMGERGCNKGFPDTGRPCDQNIQVSADPAEIATTLHLSIGTVRNYLTTIVTKLNARTRVDAVKSAYDAGWLP